MAREGSYVQLSDEGIEWLHSCGAISTKTAVLLKLLTWPHVCNDGRVWVSGGAQAIADDLSTNEHNVSAGTVQTCIKRLRKNGILSERRRGCKGVVAEYYVAPGILPVGTRRTTKQPDSWYKTPQSAGTPRTTLNNNGVAPLEAGPAEHHPERERCEDALETALANYHPEKHGTDTD